MSDNFEKRKSQEGRKFYKLKTNRANVVSHCKNYKAFIVTLK